VLALGFANPGFWLLGLGFEMAFLMGLSGNKRFQNWVNAVNAFSQIQFETLKKEALLKLISNEDRKKLSALEEKCRRVLEVYRTSQLESYLLDNNQTALGRICYLYLKILVSRRYLLNLDTKNGEKILRQQINEIQQYLENQDLVESVKNSKNATLKILEQRLSNLRRREDSLEEMESDLTRVEAQVDLALENASMQGKPHTISAYVDLSSQLFDGSLFIDAGSAITELDQNISSSSKNIPGQKHIQ
jgi:hypothetical protein